MRTVQLLSIARARNGLNFGKHSIKAKNSYVNLNCGTKESVFYSEIVQKKIKWKIVKQTSVSVHLAFKCMIIDKSCRLLGYIKVGVEKTKPNQFTLLKLIGTYSMV